MENIFSSNSLNTIEKKIDVNTQKLERIDDIDFYFEIKETCKWILENQFKRVALQFPDELLNNSVRVCSKLKENCPNVTFFILADTSYGNCCVDSVAAEHYDADSLVHYGHSCLSPVENLPVFWVFDKLPLDLDLIQTEINKLVDIEKNRKFLILYDVSLNYLYEKIKSKFQDNSNIFVSQINIPSKNETTPNTKLLFSRLLPDDLKNDHNSYSFYYVGNNSSFLNAFLFYFNKNQFYKFDTKTQQTEEIFFSKTNRELMKRYYLIEKARDSRIFGILIGTMSVSHYKEAIQHVSDLLKKANRRYYSFLIGKLNCPKLNNFMEVEMYVMIACNENSLINSKELNKPVITIYELEMAFNCSRLWGEEYVIDYKLLLEGNQHYLPIKISDQESDVSLITGETRNLKMQNEYSNTSEDPNTSSLINREKILTVTNYSPAGEFLKNRSWTGLEQNLGQSEVKKAIEGQKGIAAGYSDELK